MPGLLRPLRMGGRALGMREARGAEEAVTCDVLYVSWNRLRFTQETFAALIANTAWEHVDRLVIADDGSEDGTWQWLCDACDKATDELGSDMPELAFLPRPFGGPVAAANVYLRLPRGEAEAVAKIDNDTAVCAGWLEEMLGLLESHPDVDLLGMRPDIGPPQPCPYKGRGVKYAEFVDGNGLWRHRAFDGRPLPRGWGAGKRLGFTQWQQHQKRVVKAWASPDLPVFQLDGLPFEPWLSLSAEYAQKGWQRGWPNALYSTDAHEYWSWFTEAEAVR